MTTMTNDTKVASQLITDLTMEVMKDLNVLFEVPSSEDAAKKDKNLAAIEILSEVYELKGFAPFARDAGLTLFLISRKPLEPANWDICAALIAAYYSVIRVPQPGGVCWPWHPQSAENQMNADETLEGEILRAAALTMSRVVSQQYLKPFEGHPTDVADNIREWMKSL